MDKYEHGSDGAQAQAAGEPESADVVNVSEQEDSPLDMILRQGARKMLVAASSLRMARSTSARLASMTSASM